MSVEEPQFPGERCPDCGSEEREWKNIVGDAARPLGSIYECEDCGCEYDDVEPLEERVSWGTQP